MSYNDFYPQNSVKQLLPTELVTGPTRQALQQRLNRQPTIQPQFFSVEAFAILQAVSRRLILQDENRDTVDLAGMFDEQIGQNQDDGWRYNAMPPDQEAYRRGLQGINETALQTYQQPFINLPAEQQDEVLHSIQRNSAEVETWKHLPAGLFFEELLANLTTLYYSHPAGREDIGEVSVADAKGWTHIQLNEKENFELLPVK